MNPILQALASGFGIDKILKYLAKSNPGLASKITQAANYGYPATEILKYIMKGGSDISKNLPKASSQDMSLYDKMQYSIPEDIQNAGNLALGIGKVGLGLAALSQFGGNQTGAQQAPAPAPTTPPVAPTPAPTQPNLTPNGIPQATVQPGMNIGAQISPSTQISPAAPPTQSATTNALPASIPNAPSITNPAIPSPQVLQSIGHLQTVKSMLQAGNTPEVIATTVNSLLKGDQRKNFGEMLKSGQVKPLLELVKDIQQEQQQAQSNPSSPTPIQPEQIQQQSVIPQQEQPVQEQKSLQAPEEKPIESEAQPENPIEKKSTVATPHGVGEVKAISGDNAIIEIDGKATKIPVDELIQSPLPEKDLAQLHDDLVKGIEKATDEDLSRMVDFAGYDPKTNRLAFLPYTGALYVYDDISQEDADLLRNVLNVRKTSGENFIGAWKKDSKSPIGSAMSALIQKLQKERGGKGNEYAGKFETVYKAFEPALKASKAAKKKKDQEEKERKKPKNKK